MQTNTKTKNRYITGFDGLRTLAVIGVILYHLLPNSLKGGYLGVPVLFTISGYLITDHMNQEWQKTGGIDLKKFWGRRMKRLYPTLVFLLIITTTYITLFQRNLLNNLRGTVLSCLFYVNNWFQIHSGLSYFDRFANESPFTHIWSLAVEGQNYIIWPLLFILMKKIVKSRWRMFQVTAGLSLLSVILMAVLFNPATDPTRVYYGTDTRIFAIWLGAALAFVWPVGRLKSSIPPQAKRVLNIAGGLSLLGLILGFIFLADSSAFVYRGGLFLMSILCTIAVAVISHPGASWNRILTNPVFAWIGKRSYGIYLYQFPVMIFYESKVNVANHVVFNTLIELIIIFGITALSYRFIETPLRYFDYGKLRANFASWLKLPALSRKRIIGYISAVVTVIALFGIVTAPTNSETANQKALKAEIAANAKKAKATKKVATTESTAAAPTDTVEAKYGLTKAQVTKAQNMEITAVGDSVMLATTADLQEVFPKAVIDGSVGRQVYVSTDTFKALATQGKLANNVVVSLGTNGSFTEAQFDQIMAVLGTKRKIYWVNVYVPTKRWQNDVNAMLAKMAQKYKNVTIVDWYSTTNGQTGWLYDDQVHPNETGAIEYTKLLANQMLN